MKVPFVSFLPMEQVLDQELRAAFGLYPQLVYRGRGGCRF